MFPPMFDGIRSFIAELIGSDGERPFDENDYRMAAAAVLVHVADADGAIDALERARLQAMLSDKFDLSPGDASRMIAQAELSEAEAVDLDHFVAVLRRALDDGGRLKLVEMAWDIVYADGAPLEVEDSVVARVAQMLGVSDGDLATLRSVGQPGLASSVRRS
ncbi:MAG: hypothetical protein JWN93_2777 [Hyphomicrobiales bacterium]|jgi:uncharacterized tellurite resistance protein B-like protein|nr:hypothetical protein [Hyphomicrobiales bacterium]